MPPALSPTAPPAAPEVRWRLPPPPRRGGPLALLRFLRTNGMLGPRYLRSYARLVWLKARHGHRLQLDGIAFVGPGVEIELGAGATLRLGRWSWIGHGTKIRVHEGEVEIGAKSVLGQECTISAFQRVTIGRECIVADRAMFIDFDHGVVETDRPIRAQGIYKRDLTIGHNCWIGYGACFLRGVTVGDNCIVGAGTVVTKDVDADTVVAGAPARVLRRRPTPRSMRWG